MRNTAVINIYTLDELKTRLSEIVTKINQNEIDAAVTLAKTLVEKIHDYPKSREMDFYLIEKIKPFLPEESYKLEKLIPQPESSFASEKLLLTSTTPFALQKLLHEIVFSLSLNKHIRDQAIKNLYQAHLKLSGRADLDSLLVELIIKHAKQDIKFTSQFSTLLSSLTEKNHVMSHERSLIQNCWGLLSNLFSFLQTAPKNQERLNTVLQFSDFINQNYQSFDPKYKESLESHIKALHLTLMPLLKLYSEYHFSKYHDDTLSKTYEKLYTIFGNTPIAEEPCARILIAESLITHKEFNEAERSLTACLASHPTYLPAYILRAKIYIYLKNSQNALNDIHHLLSKFPNDYELYLLKIRAHQSANDEQQIIDTAEKLISLYPSKPNSLAHKELGLALLRQKKILEALPHLQAAHNEIKNDPSLNRALEHAIIYADKQEQENKANTAIENIKHPSTSNTNLSTTDTNIPNSETSLVSSFTGKQDSMINHGTDSTNHQVMPSTPIASTSKESALKNTKKKKKKKITNKPINWINAFEKISKNDVLNQENFKKLCADSFSKNITQANFDSYIKDAITQAVLRNQPENTEWLLSFTAYIMQTRPQQTSFICVSNLLHSIKIPKKVNNKTLHQSLFTYIIKNETFEEIFKIFLKYGIDLYTNITVIYNAGYEEFKEQNSVPLVIAAKLGHTNYIKQLLKEVAFISALQGNDENKTRDTLNHFFHHIADEKTNDLNTKFSLTSKKKENNFLDAYSLSAIVLLMQISFPIIKMLCEDPPHKLKIDFKLNEFIPGFNVTPLFLLMSRCHEKGANWSDQNNPHSILEYFLQHQEKGVIELDFFKRMPKEKMPEGKPSILIPFEHADEVTLEILARYKIRLNEYKEVMQRYFKVGFKIYERWFAIHHPTNDTSIHRLLLSQESVITTPSEEEIKNNDILNAINNLDYYSICLLLKDDFSLMRKITKKPIFTLLQDKINEKQTLEIVDKLNQLILPFGGLWFGKDRFMLMMPEYVTYIEPEKNTECKIHRDTFQEILFNTLNEIYGEDIIKNKAGNIAFAPKHVNGIEAVFNETLPRKLNENQTAQLPPAQPPMAAVETTKNLIYKEESSKDAWRRDQKRATNNKLATSLISTIGITVTQTIRPSKRSTKKEERINKRNTNTEAGQKRAYEDACKRALDENIKHANDEIQKIAKKADYSQEKNGASTSQTTIDNTPAMIGPPLVVISRKQKESASNNSSKKDLKKLATPREILKAEKYVKIYIEKIRSVIREYELKKSASELGETDKRIFRHALLFYFGKLFDAMTKHEASKIKYGKPPRKDIDLINDLRNLIFHGSHYLDLEKLKALAKTFLTQEIHDQQFTLDFSESKIISENPKAITNNNTLEDYKSRILESLFIFKAIIERFPSESKNTFSQNSFYVAAASMAIVALEESFKKIKENTIYSYFFGSVLAEPEFTFLTTALQDIREEITNKLRHEHDRFNAKESAILSAPFATSSTTHDLTSAESASEKASNKPFLPVIDPNLIYQTVLKLSEITPEKWETFLKDYEEKARKEKGKRKVPSSEESTFENPNAFFLYEKNIGLSPNSDPEKFTLKTKRI